MIGNFRQRNRVKRRGREPTGGKNQPRQEIAFTLFGDWEERLQEFDLGDQVEVTFQIKSKFVGDRSFTDLICRKIRLMHKTSKGQSSIDFGKS